jgi:hypothetical protein
LRGAVRRHRLGSLFRLCRFRPPEPQSCLTGPRAPAGELVPDELAFAPVFDDRLHELGAYELRSSLESFASFGAHVQSFCEVRTEF